MKPLIIISGPTAAGKTDISIKLAQTINGEIISADSMQVYRGMDIGSAKIKYEEMNGIPHHLIDILDPTEEFSVAVFKEYALKAIKKIYSNGHIPIIVGGTGFYIQALLYDIDFDKSKGEVSIIRTRLENELNEFGPDYLHEKLTACDPESAKIIHKNNTKRVIRALEFFEETGEKISLHNSEMRANSSPYNFAYFVLTKNRENLYESIDRRVDKMLEDGLVDEVRKLKSQGLSRKNYSMLGLGYKEILDYLDGIISLEEAVYIIKRDTRHFAKRQLTWFKREKEVLFINKEDYENENQILEYITGVIKERNII